jgi:hypothetical protein
MIDVMNEEGRRLETTTMFWCQIFSDEETIL